MRHGGAQVVEESQVTWGVGYHRRELFFFKKTSKLLTLLALGKIHIGKPGQSG